MKKIRPFYKIHLNLKLTLLIVGLFFMIIIIKLSYVVLSPNVDGINLTQFANNRNTTKEILYANRGIIYDRDGKPLAKNANSYKIIAYLSPSRTTDEKHPYHVVDKDDTAKKLCDVLGKDEKDIENCKETLIKYFNQDLYQVELGSWGRISEEEKRAVELLELPGIDFETLAKKRQYINSSWASYILGYARSDDNGEIVGEMGIESYMNDVLKGTDGFVEYQKDAYGYKMANTPENKVMAVSGSDVYLTINSDIQNVLENAVHNFSESAKADWTIFAVMDAKTGEIVGSATNPSFNPNTLNDLKSYVNPLVAYQYEPGSTMKTFSWMSAMENGVYDGSATYTSGSLTLDDGTKIKDFNNVGWGTINYDTGFAYSSNVGATNLAFKLGTAKLIDYYNLCGFGKKTKISLPGELEGKIDFTYDSELANASFGQGILVTPVQMLQAFSAIANDGMMIEPQIVKKIVDSNGNVTFEAQKKEIHSVAKHETIEKMKELLYNVVYNSFDYNRLYAPDGITVIGKTGTAQLASPDGGYLTGDNDYIRSFAGVFPKEEPKYVIYFATQRYTGGGDKISNTVAQVVKDIARVTNLTNVQNDVDHSKIIVVPQYINMALKDVLDDAKKKKLNPIVIGNGSFVINQYPLANTTTIDGSKIYIKTNGGEIKMPDVTGWTTNEIISFCNFIGIKYSLDGFGSVISTSIPKDTVIDLNAKMEIKLG